MSMLVDVQVLPTESEPVLQPDSYDYNRLPAELRDQAMLAQGTVLTKLGGAVERVIDAGNTLRWAKETLPHGEYLPWVQQACGLKPQHASQLIKAAEWVSNVGHVQHLNGLADVKTLFILSAKTTTEEVREWFMERCAAGDTPSRKEVQERKRSAGQPRAPQPTEKMALALIRKGDIERTKEALALAERSQMVADADVIAELRLRELPKGSVLKGAEADFHRLKDGQWVKMPHAGRVDVEPEPEPISAVTNDDSPEVLSTEGAANKLGINLQRLRQEMTPGNIANREGKPFMCNGHKVTREGRGLVRVTPVTP